MMNWQRIRRAFDAFAFGWTPAYQAAHSEQKPCREHVHVYPSLAPPQPCIACCKPTMPTLLDSDGRCPTCCAQARTRAMQVAA